MCYLTQIDRDIKEHKDNGAYEINQKYSLLPKLSISSRCIEQQWCDQLNQWVFKIIQSSPQQNDWRIQNFGEVIWICEIKFWYKGK